MSEGLIATMYVLGPVIAAAVALYYGNLAAFYVAVVSYFVLSSLLAIEHKLNMLLNADRKMYSS
jgi:hypothetical protein